MRVPLEVAWHDTDPVPHVEARLRQRAERLEQFFARITHIHVVVEAAHRRHQTGNEYEVRLDVGVPGSTLAVNRKPGDRGAHTDVLVAIRDAFDAMERQLRRWNEQHSGRPEVHEAPTRGRIAAIDPDAGSGEIAVTDGRLVYFHRNALVTGAFETLSIGDPVELVIDRGEDAAGAHASTVRAISEAAFLDTPG